MAEKIPQSVSYTVVFRCYLASDGKTPAVGKTIAITISKNTAAFGNPSGGATNATEISNGFYWFTLSTTDTGTLGPLAWRGAESTINDAGDVLNVEDMTTRIYRSAEAIATGTVGSGSTTTNVVASSISPAMVVANQFASRIMIFDKNTTTANLRGQATNITANDASGDITVTALTTPPVSGDTFTVT